MTADPIFTSAPVEFSVDREQGQMLVVGGSPLGEPINGALWLVHNNGPETLEIFDDHGQTLTLKPREDVLFDQAPEVNVSVRLGGTRRTTGAFSLVKTQQWQPVTEWEARLRGHGSASCISVAPADGHGHWRITYVAGNLDVDILAAHASGPGGNNGHANYSYRFGLDHDGSPRSVAVYKPYRKELSIHVNTSGKTPQDFAVCRLLSLQNDYWP